jgi:hypothetical protein
MTSNFLTSSHIPTNQIATKKETHKQAWKLEKGDGSQLIAEHETNLT